MCDEPWVDPGAWFDSNSSINAADSSDNSSSSSSSCGSGTDGTTTPSHHRDPDHVSLGKCHR